MSKIEKLTPERLVQLRELCKKSTQVVGWYAHGYDRTVRGPFRRWFTCSEVKPEYEKYVASVYDEVEFCAAAMNALPVLLDRIAELESQLKSQPDGRCTDCYRKTRPAETTSKETKDADN